MNEKKQLRIKKFAENPLLPPMHWVLGFSLSIVVIIWNAIPRGYTSLLELLVIIFTLLTTYIVWFAYKCFQNKQRIYIAYVEEEKRANSQSVLREQCEEKMDALISKDIERLAPVVLDHISQKINFSGKDTI